MSALTLTTKTRTVSIPVKAESVRLLENSNAIATGKNGKFHVVDKTMRVQHFNTGGKHLNAWIVQSEKKLIDKLAALTNGKVYVLINGELVIF